MPADPVVTTDDALETLRYPLGRFQVPAAVTAAERAELIEHVEALPGQLRRALAGLSPQQLDTPYRPGGWTVRQVAHHLSDSHINGYVRFRLALTEDEPTVKGYQQARWAELPDSRTGPLELALPLLEALHRRWTAMLRALTDEQWLRTYRDPQLAVVTIDKTLAKYAWHGRHHVAHVTRLRERNGWS